MDPLSIEGAWAYTPAIRSDARGSFLELFRGGEFLAALGYRLEVAQANCSVSRRGVIRGIHFADVPPGQAKYVSCLSGAILDVVVDLRTGSPGYGRWEAVRLDDENRRSLFISEGLGHAFTALSETATVVYLCSTPYAPGREHGVHPLDPAVGIAWPAAASRSCRTRTPRPRRWRRRAPPGCCRPTATARRTPRPCAPPTDGRPATRPDGCPGRASRRGQAGRRSGRPAGQRLQQRCDPGGLTWRPGRARDQAAMRA